jgi:hypothetical protein
MRKIPRGAIRIFRHGKNDRFPKTIEASKNFHGTKMAQKFSEPLILQAVFDHYLTLIT